MSIKISSKNNGLRARVESRMHELGMTQVELYTKADMQQSALNHILSRRTKMVSVPTLFKLADALECDARWLALGEKPE